MPRLRSPVFVPLILALASGCSAPDPASGTEAPDPEAASTTLVETVVVEATSFGETIDLTGETTPVRSAVLSSQIAGRIVRLDVDEGELVAEGDRVLRVDTGTVGSQRAQLVTQREALASDITRAEQLLARGVGTVDQLDRLTVQHAVVGDQIDAIDVAVYQGRGVAPISGVVVEKLAEVGEFASPGQPLARIVDVSTIVVRVGLPEREIRYVREGMPVAIRVLATGTEHVGTLQRIGVEADVASRTFPLEIRVDNSEGILRAGMRAMASLPKRDFEDAIVIPRDAVLQGLDGPEVLVDEGGVAGMRRVVLGPGRGAFVVIESGLQVGERLVVRGHRLLVPRERIRGIDLGRCCGAQLRRFLEGGPATIEAVADDGQLGG